MSNDEIVLRWPTWQEIRAFMRGVLGIRCACGLDEGEAMRASQARRYNGVSRCC